MTTADKIRVGVACGCMAIITGIYAFVSMRINKRSEAESKAFINSLESRVDNLEETEVDE